MGKMSNEHSWTQPALLKAEKQCNMLKCMCQYAALMKEMFHYWASDEDIPYYTIKAFAKYQRKKNTLLALLLIDTFSMVWAKLSPFFRIQ